MLTNWLDLLTYLKRLNVIRNNGHKRRKLPDLSQPQLLLVVPDVLGDVPSPLKDLLPFPVVGIKVPE